MSDPVCWGIPDMSGSKLKSHPPVAEEQLRRRVSVYDKMEAARTRRAAVLKASDPANLPTAAPPRTVLPEPAMPKTDPSPLPSLGPFASFAAHEDTEPAGRTTPKGLFRVLTVLLVALAAAAVFTLETQPPISEPEFGPPLASLANVGAGSPLLVTLENGTDRQIIRGNSTALDPVLTDRLPQFIYQPAVLPAPTPLAASIVETRPRARPADLATGLQFIRPRPRPAATPLPAE